MRKEGEDDGRKWFACLVGNGLLNCLRHRPENARPRRGSSCAGVGRLDDERRPHLSRPVAPYPRRAAEEGPQNRSARGPPKLPKELQGAIHSLHSNYARQFEAWDKDKEEFFGATPPIFIVVCGRSGAGFCAPSGTRATARLLGRGWGGGRANGANPREASKPRQGREGRQPTPVDSSRFQRRARGGGSPHPPPSQQRAICPCGVCPRQDRKRNNSTHKRGAQFVGKPNGASLPGDQFLQISFIWRTGNGFPHSSQTNVSRILISLRQLAFHWILPSPSLLS